MTAMLTAPAAMHCAARNPLDELITLEKHITLTALDTRVDATMWDERNRLWQESLQHIRTTHAKEISDCYNTTRFKGTALTGLFIGLTLGLPFCLKRIDDPFYRVIGIFIDVIVLPRMAAHCLAALSNFSSADCEKIVLRRELDKRAAKPFLVSQDTIPKKALKH
jgi:hypothetical protein